MTDKDFQKSGYTRYKPNAFHGECVTDMYQKPFKDKEGKRRYFLTWERWDFKKFEPNKNINPIRYEGSTQLCCKESGQMINIDFLNGWKLEDAETFLEKLFATGWFYPYDRG